MCTEEGFENTWEIIEAASRYSFNASHALSYAYDSVYGAYAKAHYPFEFYAVMLQHYSDKGNKNKVTEYKKEMLEYAGIKEGKYKFGLDNRKFHIDKEHSSIDPSLASIKNFSEVLANVLYELGKSQYNDFLDVLIAMVRSGVADSRIDDLIHIGYFEDFGDMKYLINYHKIFSEFYSNTNKKLKTQLKKEKALELHIDYDFIRNHCRSEAAKTFIGIDASAIIRALADKFNEKTSFKEIISARTEVLGYIDIVDKKYAGYCVCTDLNVEYSPKVKLYALANGNTIPVKINKKIFKSNPIKRGDIVKVENQYKNQR